MTSKEFTIWLKGFITACNEYSPTPKQWDIIKEELEKVSDEQKIGTPIGQGGWGTPNVAPIMPLPYYPNPLENPFKVTCSTGSFGTSGYSQVITTTPGTGYITIANPNIASFSGSYNPMTTTLWNPSGSVWSYTNSKDGKIF